MQRFCGILENFYGSFPPIQVLHNHIPCGTLYLVVIQSKHRHCLPLSYNRLFRDTANAGNLAPGQVLANVPKVFLEFFQGGSLGHIVGELFQVAKLHVFILLVNVSCFVHNIKDTNPVGLFNVVLVRIGRGGHSAA